MHTIGRDSGDGGARRTPADGGREHGGVGDGGLRDPMVGAGGPRRTPAGDVILAAPRATSRARPRRRERADAGGRGGTRWLRATAIGLGMVALAAALIAVVALANGGRLPGEGGGAGPAALPAAPPATTGTQFGTRPVRPYPSPRPSAGSSSAVDGPGGISAARDRVAGFVAAMNRGDFDLANTFLCTALAGSYDESSLDGIVPGSLGVGGVTVQGDTGTAVVAYQPTGGGDPEHAVYGLVVQGGEWMLCNPQ